MRSAASRRSTTATGSTRTEPGVRLGVVRGEAAVRQLLLRPLQPADAPLGGLQPRPVREADPGDPRARRGVAPPRRRARGADPEAPRREADGRASRLRGRRASRRGAKLERTEASRPIPVGGVREEKDPVTGLVRQWDDDVSKPVRDAGLRLVRRDPRARRSGRAGSSARPPRSSAASSRSTGSSRRHRPGPAGPVEAFGRDSVTAESRAFQGHHLKTFTGQLGSADRDSYPERRPLRPRGAAARPARFRALRARVGRRPRHLGPDRRAATTLADGLARSGSSAGFVSLATSAGPISGRPDRNPLQPTYMTA